MSAVKKVLLVEDHDLSRDVMFRFLTKRGYKVLIAIDGDGGVYRALHDDPDLIIMDVFMPGNIDGLEAVRCIRKSGSKIPIITLTAYATKVSEEEAHKAGCDLFLTKPIESFDEFVHQIESLLRKSHE